MRVHVGFQSHKVTRGDCPGNPATAKSWRTFDRQSSPRLSFPFLFGVCKDRFKPDSTRLLLLISSQRRSLSSLLSSSMRPPTEHCNDVKMTTLSEEEALVRLGPPVTTPTAKYPTRVTIPAQYIDLVPPLTFPHQCAILARRSTRTRTIVRLHVEHTFPRRPTPLRIFHP